MKQFILTSVLLATACGTQDLSNLTAKQVYVGGSKCGLTDTAGEGWVQFGKSYDLRDATESEVAKLPTLTKQQLIVWAKEYLRGTDDVVIHSTIDAVKFLREYSDDNTLKVFNFKIKGRQFTQVKHYPGDNPYGGIFAYGTLKLVATDSDDSIECK